MMTPNPATPVPQEFSQQAAETQPTLIAEFFDFLVHNKAWWLSPIIVVMLLFSLIVVLAATPAAPLLYSFF